MLDVLEQVGLSKEEVAHKMIEVRNKIDLVEMKNSEANFEESENVVNISATCDINIERFREMLIKRVYKNFGCFEHRFVHDFKTHDERINWLKELTNKECEYKGLL